MLNVSKIWLFDVLCSISKALYSVSNGHYTESGNYYVSDGRKGRYALSRSVSHLMKNETHVRGLLWGAYPFNLIAQKR
jgi:hypothetical protein